MANKAVGLNVIFTPNNKPSATIFSRWSFGETLIIKEAPDGSELNPDYEGRVSFNNKTLALELRDLRLDDSGMYILTVVTSTAKELMGKTSLQVFG
ncbi:hypothetical protein M9458_052650 [Cirrhinus mrigala]|uniref:Immunoglobulin V-set domain-containing protein n=1 Tax=Cirrhinus mrigala TaxID=683832 RepID=A0ABD0MU13_CIRMR